MFPLCGDYGLLVRAFPFNVHEATMMIEGGHENPKDEEPLAVWTMLMTRQQWGAAMYK